MIKWQEAVTWALTQKTSEGKLITENTNHELVDKVREYLNDNEVEYETFGYADLTPYLPQ